MCVATTHRNHTHSVKLQLNAHWHSLTAWSNYTSTFQSVVYFEWTQPICATGHIRTQKVYIYIYIMNWSISGTLGEPQPRALIRYSLGDPPPVTPAYATLAVHWQFATYCRACVIFVYTQRPIHSIPRQPAREHSPGESHGSSANRWHTNLLLRLRLPRRQRCGSDTPLCSNSILISHAKLMHTNASNVPPRVSPAVEQWQDSCEAKDHAGDVSTPMVSLRDMTLLKLRVPRYVQHVEFVLPHVFD